MTMLTISLIIKIIQVKGIDMDSIQGAIIFNARS